MKRVIITLRILFSIAVGAGFAFVSSFAGLFLSGFVVDAWGPLGNGSADPRGRGGPIFEDQTGVFIPILFGIFAAWLTWLVTDRRNWTTDLFVAAPIFLISGPIAAANWLSWDTIFTREAQAVLNLLLIASGLAVAYILQSSLKSLKTKFLLTLGSCLLAICIYAFVATPLWYTFSYLSWKLGAGELKSFDEAADAIKGAGSLLAVVGILWKGGRLSSGKRGSDAEK